MRIAVVVGSTRPNRNGDAVARWVLAQAQKRTEARFELLDVAEQRLPLLDEPVPPSAGKYSKAHTVAWAAKVDAYDGFVFVTAEYNHGIPAALKNAIDYLYKEWNNKAAGFVSYGSAGGVRAVEHLRDVLAEVQVATVRNQVMLSLRDDFQEPEFRPRDFQSKALDKMLDQLIPWTRAMRTVRQGSVPAHADPHHRPPRPHATKAPELSEAPFHRMGE